MGIHHFASRASLTLILLSIPAIAEDVPLIVDFRDGTVLRIALPDESIPWRRVYEDGVVANEPVKLSRVKQIRFVTTPATERVARVRRMTTQLGADSFHSREKAQRDLLADGAKFLSILEQALTRSKDFEVRWRLKEIIKEVISDNEGQKSGFASNDYDQLTLNENTGEEIHGDVGEWSVKAKYLGEEITISRRNVLSLRNDTIQLNLFAEPPVVSMNRIERDDDDLFPIEAMRIDFDKGPRGETLAPGTDISEVYVPMGVIFQSSYKDSYVAIELYNVGGRSGGRCAATHKPLYQGTMTIRFCKPGKAEVPAGVKYIGFWTSHIAPDGTALQAYDARGRQIAEIKTIKNQRDFVALSTNIPISYIRIVPDEDIDPDYAIDDLVFDMPTPLNEAGDPDRYSVVLTSGERLHGSSLVVENDTMILKELTVNKTQIRLPLSKLAILVPPRTPLPEVEEDKRCFVRLSDGSVLRARGVDGLQLTRFPEIAIDANRLVALWGKETILEQPTDAAWPEKGAILISGNKEYKPIPDWKIGKTWIDSSYSPANPITYDTSPVVWFRKPTKRPRESGLLRTSSGEEIVLGTKDGFELKSWSLEGISLSRSGKEWTIGMAEVRSLLLPPTRTEN